MRQKQRQKEEVMRNKIGYLRSLERNQQVSGKKTVRIDPAKENHQAVVLDKYRMQKGKSFSFQSSYEGYNETLCAGCVGSDLSSCMGSCVESTIKK